MQNYLQDVYYSIHQSENGKVRVVITARSWSFGRDIEYSSIEKCKANLENDIALFIADTKELFPEIEESKEQGATHSLV